MPDLYRIDQPQVMHEEIDGEVVVIHLDTGIYYSFDGVAGHLWRLLGERPRSAAELIEAMAASYSGERERIAEAVRSFLAQLVEENLALVVEGETQAFAMALAGAEAPAFRDPLLNRYTDMESLLLVDPIHEVDEGAGWPKVK